MSDRNSLSNSLTDLFDNLYQPYKLADASKSCIYQYRLNLRRFSDFLGHTASVEDLRDELLTGCGRWLIDTRGLSRASASKLQKQIACLWRFLARKHIVEHWPEFRVFREPKRAPIAYTRDEIRAIWKVIGTVDGTWGGIPRNLWVAALVSLLWDTGSRCGPIFKARVSWIDLSRQAITIPAEFVKNGDEDRVYQLRPSTIQILSLAFAGMPQSRRLFVGKKQCDFSGWYGKNILEPAGVKNDRAHKLHCWRRSVATHLKVAGGDPTAALNHSTDAVTRAHYLDPTITQSDIPWLKLFPLDGPAA